MQFEVFSLRKQTFFASISTKIKTLLFSNFVIGLSTYLRESKISHFYQIYIIYHFTIFFGQKKHVVYKNSSAIFPLEETLDNPESIKIPNVLASVKYG